MAEEAVEAAEEAEEARAEVAEEARAEDAVLPLVAQQEVLDQGAPVQDAVLVQDLSQQGALEGRVEEALLEELQHVVREADVPEAPEDNREVLEAVQLAVQLVVRQEDHQEGQPEEICQLKGPEWLI